MLSGFEIDKKRVERVWIELKRRYPLLGARVHEEEEKASFVVSEDRILCCLPDEITFSNEGGSWDEAQAFADDLVNTEEGSHVLDEKMLARVWVLLCGGEQRMYVVLAVAHVITDGMSNMLLLRRFLEGLFGGEGGWDWEERLGLCLASEDLNRARWEMSLARRRWRRAIADVMAENQLDKLKVTSFATTLKLIDLGLQGGHTIPRRITSHTLVIAARSKCIVRTLSATLSEKIMRTCRAEGITFGDAYPIIGQLATARVLLRRYLRNEIGEEEWMWRRREGMCSAGPVNLRRFFEREDYVGVALGFYHCSIGFLPLGAASKMEEMPPVGGLLTRERFVFRAREVQKQKRRYLESGLCLEMGDAFLRRRGRVEMARGVAKEWTRQREGEEKVVNAMDQAGSGFVLCNGGSSMGNVDGLLPADYRGLRLERDVTRLRCRPGEFYLGAKTQYGQMHIHVFFDANVVEEEVAREWMDEVELALEYYLGRSQDIYF